MKPTFISRIISSSFLVAGAAVILLPFVWMLSLAFKPRDEIFSTSIQLLPSRLEWSNFIFALTETNIPLFLWNGTVVVLGILVFQVMFAVPCAYALTQRRFLARKLIFGLVMIALMVPFHVTAIPIFLGFAQVGILNTYWALILPFIPTAFGIFLFRQFFAQLPSDLFDAARVDGLSETAIVWRIAFPLALPAATAFAIFSVTTHWNDLFWPMIATTDPNLATPPRGILYFRDEESGDNVGPLMAAAFIVTAPLVILFLMAQRKFIQGLASGGIKG
ncbi:carbohydrate ABC transporter permease [Marinomonas foliarum]|jgi:multiple sugar transport system permease protein|uniref:sn-glycerol-3-phosphate transport system permease protein UgpE n=1 Tax=Marinomonas foliarum TaxID=491950 RepID=A0A369AGP8_9GAMM|nr:carbohydrate ABC transporter permease [Marinomonas foliarum]RCX08313.1 carbohydrate ABC transporter membrane protein 2 (CUT1 family) [Marinomonas foliarum]